MQPAARPSHTDRRRFLRGAGVALALPWLPSLAINRRAAAALAGSVQPPLRAAFLYFPNGAWMKDWVPTDSGRDYTLPFSLEPLAPVREQLLVLSGLDKRHSRRGDGHYAKTANFLTGLPVAKTTGADISSGGISVDQLMARQTRGLTPLPSLELSTEPVVSGVDSNVGFTRLYGSHISWESANRPVAREIDPRLVYERLFGGGLTGSQTAARNYQHLLDYVLEDARGLRHRLSRDDQYKMDEFLDSVRSVERRLEFQQNSERSLPTAEQFGYQLPESLTHDPREHVSLMLDMLTLAFRSDATRVASFMFANDVSGRNFSFVDGVRGGHHEMSHHEGQAEKIEQYKRITRWHVEQLAGFLTRLAEIPEGEGSLLDHCMIMFGSSISDGNRHDPDNLPILLAGGGGGSLATGQHLHFEGERPLCDLYLSMLQRMGVATESFGDSQGTLSEIDT
jgi:hypothetical protein